jgi:hypothetical protein
LPALECRQEKMRIRSAARMQAWERRTAAIHEAGHYVVALAVGSRCVSARIERNKVSSPDERTWIGSAESFPFGQRQARQRRMIACAGSVAEFIYNNEGDPPDPDCWFDPEAMSASDWHLTDCAPGCPDDSLLAAIRRVGVMLDIDGPKWPKLMLVARRLIIDSRKENSPREQAA